MDAAVQGLMYQGKAQEKLAVGDIEVDLLKRLRQVLPGDLFRSQFQTLLDDRWAGPGEAAAVVQSEIPPVCRHPGAR